MSQNGIELKSTELPFFKHPREALGQDVYCRMKKIAHPAFTLLELLVVITIIGVLSSLVGPAVNTMLRGSRLTQAGDKVVAVLNMARQTALTRNHSVEVRFYQYGDPDVPGEKVADPNSGRYRAIQAFEYDDAGTATALGKMEKLPLTIVMNKGTTLSSLLDSTRRKQWGKNEAGEENPPPKIPNAGISYHCCAFRFLSDGSTNLSNKLWFVTLHNLTDGDPLEIPPANYMTIKIDPVNGSLKTFRP